MKGYQITLSSRRTCKSNRKAFSLLEVVLAITVLGLALVALGELIRLGSQSAATARDLSRAQLLCDSKMSEIRAGILPLESTAGAPIMNVPGWEYSVVVTPETATVGLMKVECTVSQQQTGTRPPVSFTLHRLVPDPEYQPETPEE